MNQAEIHQFLINFFTKRQAQIDKNENGLLTVKLTEELDQQLMNRPFYWQYVKKLGQKGDPMTVTFISNENKREEKGEWIHYGSPRLEQLFQIILNEGKYAELYESVQPSDRQAMHPWFICNILVRYQGAYTHDEMVSVGVYLLNGTMRFRMMEEIMVHDFNESIPDLCYKIPPIISKSRAIDMIDHELTYRIRQKSLEFDSQSFSLYKKELTMTKQFFQNRDEDAESHKLRIEQQIYERLYPKVKLIIVNCGLFYLTEQQSKKIIKI